MKQKNHKYCCPTFKYFVKENIFRYYPYGNHFAGITRDNYGIIVEDKAISSMIYYCPFCGKKIKM